jgi:hypothetical protein
MKHKYRIWKDVKGKQLMIQEYAVLTADSRKQKLPGLDDEDFSLLCEQTYQADEVKKATSSGKDELILYLRNHHFFPIGPYIELIADAVVSMYAAKGEQREDLVFDDKEVLKGNLPEAETEVISEIEDNLSENGSSDEIDELLEDDTEIPKKTAGGKKKPESDDEGEEY